MVKILLTPGHRSTNPGASGGGTSEFFLSRDIIRKATAELAKMPQIQAQIITIEDSISLRDKIKQVNRIKPDLAVEIHWNACAHPHVYGSEAFYAVNGSRTSEDMAQLYCNVYEDVSGRLSRGSKTDNNSQYNRLGWCRNTVCPAILVENEFLTWEDFELHFYTLISVTALVRFVEEALNYLSR
jgi:N-acetylmuramoyl-L-alanine amidase